MKNGGITATALVWSSQDLTGELVPLYPAPPAREISEAEVLALAEKIEAIFSHNHHSKVHALLVAALEAARSPA
jgi:hypothetical protein